MSESIVQDVLPRLPRSGSLPKPKGILKNTPQTHGTQSQLAILLASEFAVI